MINITNKSDCTGCSACAACCPKQCITLNVDNEGFLYPNVDLQSCVDCHLCEKKCPITNQGDASLMETELFAAFALDDEIRAESSSGGVFSLLANQIIEANGCVYGAAFDEKFHLKHICVESKECLAWLRGSKYLQSDMNDVIQRVKYELSKRRKVLFSGCPCQVNGLLNIIGEQPNLFTIDFVCHGVPSPKIFSKYLESKKNNHGIDSISFRNKKHGWKTFSLAIDYDDKTQYSKILTHDKYMQMFLRNLILRPSCYECNQPHRSDITLADYWTIKKHHPEMNDDKGISMVYVNTPIGKEYWTAIKNKMTVISDGVVANQKQMGRSVPLKRSALFADIDNCTFAELHQKHVYQGFVKETAQFFKGYVKLLFHYLRLYNLC